MALPPPVPSVIGAARGEGLHTEPRVSVANPLQQQKRGACQEWMSQSHRDCPGASTAPCLHTSAELAQAQMLTSPLPCLLSLAAFTAVIASAR